MSCRSCQFGIELKHPEQLCAIMFSRYVKLPTLDLTKYLNNIWQFSKYGHAACRIGTGGKKYIEIKLVISEYSTV